MNGVSRNSLSICLIRPAAVISTNSFAAASVPPIGVAYLGAVLRESDYSVTIIDGIGEAIDQYEPIPGRPKGMRQGLSDRQIVDRIPVDVDVIGVSIPFSLEWPFQRSLIGKIRKRFPNVVIIAGGEHVTALPEYTLSDCQAIDYCVLGEGEQILLNLVDVLKKDGDVRKVGGLCMRSGKETIRTTGQKRIRDLDAMPIPAWDLVPIEVYLKSSNMQLGVDFGRTIPILASRGCPYRCTFCSNANMWRPVWLKRSPANVFNEIKDYVHLYHATNFDFFDSTAIVNRDWIIALCKLIIDSRLNITWQLPSGTRSEAIDSEVGQLLHDSGCRYMSYAPESGSIETLKLIKKKISKDRMLKSIRESIRTGLGVKANIVLGFPHEKRSNIKETYSFILKLALAGVHDISVFAYSPYPGSELFKELLDSGKIQLNDDYFDSLSGFLDPLDQSRTFSYCEAFSNRKIWVFCQLGWIMFYAVSYFLRPWRAFKTIIEVYKDEPKNKISQTIVRVLKKRKLIRKIPVPFA